MTRIVIDGVETVQDLYDALAKVAHAFRNPTRFASAEQRFYNLRHRPGPDTSAGAASGSAPAAPPEPPLPPYVPCPRRGSHLRLTDCWVCFGDVLRGACLEIDAVSAQGWDAALDRLAARFGVPDHPPADLGDADAERGEWLTLPFADSTTDEGDEAA